MEMKIALAGNPNCGKTTLFNALTGSSQYVGNWPGVTVEKKEGKLKKYEGVTITDLPGIYSLSPYTLEEVVARDYLVSNRPNAIINIIDGTNLERNLYLTTQLLELGIPTVIAINMMDIVRKNGDKIDIDELSSQLGCKVVCISAIKKEGIIEAAEAAIEAAKSIRITPKHSFSGPVEHVIAHIEEHALSNMPDENQRWYAVKLFERDEKVLSTINLSDNVKKEIEEHIAACEKELDDDAESIITNERYIYISNVIKSCYKKKNVGKSSVSDKIDKVVTNRILALPIFAVIMMLVYSIAMAPRAIGTYFTDWANDGLFGDGWFALSIGRKSYDEALERQQQAISSGVLTEQADIDPKDFGPWVPGVPVLVEKGLDSINTAPWLKGLVLDGIVAGVGAVLGFLPQIIVLFILLALLEGCGYMARIAFVMDRIFRKFGLSGKSFIPILVATGCAVPGIMASRTIENERDRRMTIMTTTFIPCSAKLPFISLVAGAIFGGSPLVAVSAYFIGLFSIISSGIILKKTKPFRGEAAAFVMELPAYHIPTLTNVSRSVKDRSSHYIKKAGSIILLSTIIIWVLSHFGWGDAGFGVLEDEEIDRSILAYIGRAVSWIFAPLGWGKWQATVATIAGLIAKENIVSTLAVLYDAAGGMQTAFGSISGYSFLLFNLLCAPCFAAMGAIRAEMKSNKWFWAAVGYECGFAYFMAFVVNQIGSAVVGRISVFPFILSIIAISGFVYMMAKKPDYSLLKHKR